MGAAALAAAVLGRPGRTTAAFGGFFLLVGDGAADAAPVGGEAGLSGHLQAAGGDPQLLLCCCQHLAGDLAALEVLDDLQGCHGGC